jgi:hypothetical protein
LRTNLGNVFTLKIRGESNRTVHVGNQSFKICLLLPTIKGREKLTDGTQFSICWCMKNVSKKMNLLTNYTAENKVNKKANWRGRYIRQRLFVVVGTCVT